MRGIKRIVAVLTVLLIALMVLAFILENQQKVTLSVLGWSTSQMPVSVFVVLALIVGLLAGPVFVLLFRRKSHKQSFSSAS
ncbi:lipopolysaccharide assembly protein LapA domain-containing protein [Pseudomonas pergaminensis]